MDWVIDFSNKKPKLFYSVLTLVIIGLTLLLLWKPIGDEINKNYWTTFIGIFGTIATLMGFILTLVQIKSLKPTDALIREAKLEVVKENIFNKITQSLNLFKEKFVEHQLKVSFDFDVPYIKQSASLIQEIKNDLTSHEELLKSIGSDKSSHCKDCLESIDLIHSKILNDIDSKIEEQLPSRKGYMNYFDEIFKSLTKFSLNLK